MRITGGTLSGRHLRVPRQGMRPTQDRVRESLFARLAPVLEGARVLDLFGGTGALGLEAWSRGAASVAWVEMHAATVKLLEQNVEELCGGTGAAVQVFHMDVASYLQHPPREPFSLIFADPPYAGSLRNAGKGGSPRFSARSEPAQGWPMLLLEQLAAPGWLDADGYLILEQGANEPEPDHPYWKLTTERVYGITRLRVFTPNKVEI
jgi:16S rRNA (guanine966-N2)-methyltransferase